jgi:hypothetical protein
MLKITLIITLMLTTHIAYAEDTNLQSNDSDTKSGRLRIALQQAEEEERLEREGVYGNWGPVHFQPNANEAVVLTPPPLSLFQRIRKGLTKLRIK